MIAGARSAEVGSSRRLYGAKTSRWDAGCTTPSTLGQTKGTSVPKAIGGAARRLPVLGGKWKPGILFNLLVRPMRFAELHRKLGVTEKVLTHQLRELEAHGVIARAVSNDVPPRVTYSLTKYGRTLKPILERMGRWGEEHLARLQRARPVSSLPSRGTRRGAPLDPSRAPF